MRAGNDYCSPGLVLVATPPQCKGSYSSGDFPFEFRKFVEAKFQRNFASIFSNFLADSIRKSRGFTSKNDNQEEPEVEVPAPILAKTSRHFVNSKEGALKGIGIHATANELEIDCRDRALVENNPVEDEV